MRFSVVLHAALVLMAVALAQDTPSPTRAPTRPPTQLPSRAPSFPTASPTTPRPTPKPTRAPTYVPTSTWAPVTFWSSQEVQGVPMQYGALEFDRMDLDLREMDLLLHARSMNFPSALDVFANGKYSRASVGAGYRSLQELGSNWLAVGSVFHEQMENYFGESDFGMHYVRSALNNSGAFYNRHPLIRAEAGRGALYWVVLPSIVNSMADVVKECTRANYEISPVATMEQAWALYSGSFNLTANSNTSTPFSLYELADSGPLSALAAGAIRSVGYFAARTACPQAHQAMREFVETANVILVRQLVQSINQFADDGQLAFIPTEEQAMQQPFGERDLVSKIKQARVWNVLGPLLPQIHACNPSVGLAFQTHFGFPVNSTSSRLPPQELIALLQSTYACLGVTCALVGDCASALPVQPPPSAPVLAQYHFQTAFDLATGVNQVDRAMADMVLHVPNFPNMKELFMGGDGVLRRRLDETATITLNGMADPAKFDHNKGAWAVARRFHRNEYFSSDFVLNALEGTGAFEGKPAEFRTAAALRGTQVSVVWHYVMHQLEASALACAQGNTPLALELVDQAWAAHTGTQAVHLLFAVNVEQCQHDARCDSRGESKVNNQLLALMTKAQVVAEFGDCQALDLVVDEIQAVMTVPLLQGVLRYSALAASSSAAWAEAWSFAFAALPLVNAVDSGAADRLTRNLDPDSVDATPMQRDSPKELAKSVVGVLGKLNLTCSHFVLDSDVASDCPTLESGEDEDEDDYSQEYVNAVLEYRRARQANANKRVALAVVLPILYVLSLALLYVFARRYFYIRTDITALVAERRMSARNSFVTQAECQ